MTARIARVAGLIMLMTAVPAQADPVAVVARSVIYPGQTVTASALISVDASNCPNCDPGFIEDIASIDGMIAVKTLVPGKLIFPDYLRKPSAVMPGKEVAVYFRKGALQISMRGDPLAEAGIGETVQVRNRESGTTIIGTVDADGSVVVGP